MAMISLLKTKTKRKQKSKLVCKGQQKKNARGAFVRSGARRGH